VEGVWRPKLFRRWYPANQRPGEYAGCQHIGGIRVAAGHPVSEATLGIAVRGRSQDAQARVVAPLGKARDSGSFGIPTMLPIAEPGRSAHDACRKTEGRAGQEPLDVIPNVSSGGPLSDSLSIQPIRDAHGCGTRGAHVAKHRL
jgi:hypothetical protein